MLPRRSPLVRCSLPPPLRHAPPLRRPVAVAHVFWDLDNLQPVSLRGPAGVGALAEALAASPAALAGCRPGLTAFANPATLRRLTALEDERAAAAALVWELAAINGELVSTGARRQSADLALRSQAVAFAKEHRAGGAVACASADSGFAEVMRYCAALGCMVVSLGEQRTRRRRGGAATVRLAGMPLPRAAHAAAAFTRPQASSGAAWEVGETWVNPAMPMPLPPPAPGLQRVQSAETGWRVDIHLDDSVQEM